MNILCANSTLSLTKSNVTVAAWYSNLEKNYKIHTLFKIQNTLNNAVYQKCLVGFLSDYYFIIAKADYYNKPQQPKTALM